MTRISKFALALLGCALGPASGEVLFKAGFETGDLSEWSQTGTRGQNATPRNVQVVTGIVREGKYDRSENYSRPGSTWPPVFGSIAL